MVKQITLDDFFTPNLINQAHQIEEIINHAQLALVKNRAKSNTQFDGNHSKNKAGSGGEFWEYRALETNTDAAKIDWRKSAKSDGFFSKSVEEKTPKLIQFWADLRVNMHWSSAATHKTKAEVAAIFALGLIWHFKANAERVAIINDAENSKTNNIGANNLMPNLWASGQRAPSKLSKGDAIFLSDGLEPIENWRQRLSLARAKNCTVLLCLICDPEEKEFNYKGRIEFTSGDDATKLLVNDCEMIRGGYLQKYNAHFHELQKLCNDFGAQTLIIDNTQSTAINAQKIWQSYCQLNQSDLAYNSNFAARR